MNHIYELAVTAIYLANFLLVIDLIFRGKRNTETTITWIVILILAPALGFFLYAVFGRSIAKNNMFSIKEKEDQIIKKQILENHVELDASIDPYIEEHKDMIYTLANSNNAHYTDSNSVDIYPSSEEFFPSLLEELKNAKEYINIQFYIFKDDNIGRKVIDILERKAAEGVEVRLLYDAVGGRFLSKKTIKELKASGVKVAEFFPAFLKVINFNLNYRNHRKIVVIDGKVGFVGGFNIGDEYLGRYKKFGKWRDTHVKLAGGCVVDLNMRFLLDWRYSSKEDEDMDLSKYFKGTGKKAGDVGIQIVSSGPDITDLDEVKYGYMKIIQKARNYVYIQTPYLILDKTLMETFKVASLSGVDVRIMIPSKPDHPFVYWASYAYAGELLNYGVRIYTYDENAFLHAKTVVSDDSVLSIGSANMDIRSLELNFEVNAFIYSEKKAIEQRLIFENDIKNSKEVTKEIYDNRGTYIRFKESISRLLSPVL